MNYDFTSTGSTYPIVVRKLYPNTIISNFITTGFIFPAGKPTHISVYETFLKAYELSKEADSKEFFRRLLLKYSEYLDFLGELDNE